MLGSILDFKNRSDGFEYTVARVVNRPLSARCRQVIELVAQGLPNREIRARSGIVEGTVKQYVSWISLVTGACNRTQLVPLFHADKLTEPLKQIPQGMT
jgi:DNA-binding NarL/FixJ family response regulator